MNVVLVWPSFQPNNAAGVRGRAFAATLADLGVHVTVLAYPEEGATDPVAHQGTGTVTIETVPLARDPGREVLGGRRELTKRAAAAAPDLVVASTPSALWFVQVERALRGLAPFVADVRDLGARSLAALNGPRLKYWALEQLEAASYRRADAVLCVSGLMGRALTTDYGVLGERVHVVPNGANLASFALDEPVEKRYDVIYNGTLEGRRADELVETFQRLHERVDARVLLLGWRDNATTRAMKGAFSERGLDAAVERVAPVPFTEVPGYLARGRVGIVPLEAHPIYRMAVGAKVYEYFAAGLPVVALGPPGETELGNLLERTGAGHYTHDVDGFVDALLGILDDEERAARLSKSAMNAAKIYDRRSIVEEAWHRVLRPLAEGGT